METNLDGVDAQVGGAIRSRREALGLTQRQMADLLRASHGLRLDDAALARIERGERSLRVSTLVTIAGALGVPAEYLMPVADVGEAGLRDAIVEADHELAAIDEEFGDTIRRLVRRLDLAAVRLEVAATARQELTGETNADVESFFRRYRLFKDTALAAYFHQNPDDHALPRLMGFGRVE